MLEGDDGLPVEEVGEWAIAKHRYLCRYIDISRGVRGRWLGPGKAGATYVDLFSGPGRSKERRSGSFIDGSCVAAWKQSVQGKSPFSAVYIGDADDERRQLAAQRLRRLGAPVIEVHGNALQSSAIVKGKLNPFGLHFAFLDPYNLGAFDYSVVKNLSGMKRIDMLVHVSKMDLQRNLGFNVAAQQTAFDRFAPGWRANVNLNQNQSGIRRDVLEYWRGLVAAAGVAPSVDMKLITGGKGQHLYWLVLAAKHEIAHSFWQTASQDGQASMF